MNNSFHKIFNESTCLSEETMLAYTENRLTPKEKHGVEKHLLHCEFCSEAMEGLFLVENNKQRLIVERINNRLKEKLREKNAKVISIHRRTVLAVAATITLLIGLSVFFYRSFDQQQEMKNLSENTEVKEDIQAPAAPQIEESETSVQEEEKAEERSQNVRKSDIKEAPDLKKAMKSDEPQAVAKLSAADAVEPEPKAEIGTSSNEGSRQPDDLSEDRLSQSKAEEKAVAAPSSIAREEYQRMSSKKNAAAPRAAAESAQIRSAESPSQILQSAVHMYENKNYRNAINLFKEVLSNEPENDKALFYCGTSYMNLGQFNESADYLSKVKKGGFYDDAQWNLANVYLKQGDKKKAKKIFRNISEQEGKYKEKALKVLNEIE